MDTLYSLRYLESNKIKTIKTPLEYNLLTNHNLSKKILTVKTGLSSGFWLNNLLLKIKHYIGDDDITVFLKNQDFINKQLAISFQKIFKLDKYQINIDRDFKASFYYIQRHHIEDLLVLDPIFEKFSGAGIQIDQIEFLEMLLTRR